MKTIQLLILLIGFSATAQYTQIIYTEPNSKIKEYKTKSANKTSLEAIEYLNESEKLRSKIKFELIYNNEKSVFKRTDLIIPEMERLNYFLAVPYIGLDTYYYKTPKEKYIVKDSKVIGEILKIIYPNNQYDWKLTKETKTILGHKCHKAIAHYKGPNDTADYIYTAWFTYDIKLPYGPYNLTGLPGVVLEVQENRNDFKRIRLKATEINTIQKFPKIPKGREIDYIEYGELMDKS